MHPEMVKAGEEAEPKPSFLDEICCEAVVKNEANDGIHAVALQKIEQVESSRRAHRMRRYHSVVKVGFFLFAIPPIFMVVNEFTTHYSRDHVQILVFLFGTLGVVIISTCPLTELDMDTFMEMHPFLRIGMALSGVFATGMIASVVPPGLHIVQCVGFFWMACCYYRSCTPRATLFGVAFLISDSLFWSVAYLVGHNSGMTKSELSVSVISAVILWCGCLQMLLLVLWASCRKGYNGTLLLYHIIYSSVAWQATEKIWRCIGSQDLVWGLAGVAQCLPVMVVLIVGRSRLFGFMARQFERDRDRSQLDGAFIAELLGSTLPVVGQTWWEYEEDPDDGPGKWLACKVVELREGCIAVMDAKKDVKWLSYAGQSNAEMLLLEARQDLRCIEWRNMSLELMKCCPGEPLSNGSTPLEMSRPACPGEVIDYFLSHVVEDDPELKFKALEELAKSFFNARRRWPTFWFDLACLDPSSVTDPLGKLPIAVMSCKKFIVILSPVYQYRLWCIWEVFTLFAFSPLDLALDKVVVMPLPGRSMTDMLLRLSRFDIKLAKCFDPNQQERLLRVVGALGSDRFNYGIRFLANQIRMRGAAAQEFEVSSTLISL